MIPNTKANKTIFTLAIAGGLALFASNLAAEKNKVFFTLAGAVVGILATPAISGLVFEHVKEEKTV